MTPASLRARLRQAAPTSGSEETVFKHALRPMELAMRRTTPEKSWLESDNIMSLDWTSLGRLVRRRTLEALAVHFALRGSDEGRGAVISESDRPILVRDQ